VRKKLEPTRRWKVDFERLDQVRSSFDDASHEMVGLKNNADVIALINHTEVLERFTNTFKQFEHIPRISDATIQADYRCVLEFVDYESQDGLSTEAKEKVNRYKNQELHK
jgi:hypothetical protein